MPETSNQPGQTEGFISQSRGIFDKYIYDVLTLRKLIGPPKVSDAVTTEAAREITLLSPAGTGQMTAGLFSIIGNEKPSAEPAFEQDAREGALTLFKLIDFSKINNRVLLETYLSQINSTPRDAEAFGSIYSLLAAGVIIAPHLPEGRISTRPLTGAWKKVIMNCLINLPIQVRRETYFELREVLNTIISGLPVPAESPAAPIPAAPVKSKPKTVSKRPKENPEVGEDHSLKIFKEVLQNVGEYEFTPGELPWLKENMLVQLDHATLRNENIGFYLGMCIAKGDPANTAGRMTPRQKRSAFNTFYTILPEFITQHTSGKIKTLNDQLSAARILYTTNPGGQRLYFMETEKINNEPVIIVIGMCDKAQQIPLLRAFTTTSFKDLKRLGKI